MIGLSKRIAIGCTLMVGGLLQAQEPQTPGAKPPFLDALRLSDPARMESEAKEGKEAKKDEIETDRDSFTPAVSTTPKGRVIFESAWSFEDNRGRKETNSFPEALIRYGLTERLELRLGWNYEVGGAPGEVSGGEAGGEDLPFERKNKLERESVLSYGLKYRLTEQEGWLPGSSAIVQAITPTYGKANDTQVVGTYVFGWELPNRMKLDSSFRYGTGSEGRDKFNEWAPSIVLKAPIGERISVHAEYFGIFSSGKAERINSQFFSPGASYLVTENFEVGFRLGWGLNDTSARFFTNVGIGVRF